MGFLESAGSRRGGLQKEQKRFPAGFHDGNGLHFYDEIMLPDYAKPSAGMPESLARPGRGRLAKEHANPGAKTPRTLTSWSHPRLLCCLMGLLSPLLTTMSEYLSGPPILFNLQGLEAT